MLYILDLLGVAIFAVTGAITAGQKRMDVFGIIVVGIVTALRYHGSHGSFGFVTLASLASNFCGF